MRSIDDILLFREDISPFLVHLTRDYSGRTAKQALELIIQTKQLKAGEPEVSDARFGLKTTGMHSQDKIRFFGAVCLTETPINEIHCLLEISGRKVNLKPYGLVFLKSQLQQRGIAPVNYINNEAGDGDVIMPALASLIQTHEAAAAKLLPLISVFGKKLTAPSAPPQEGRVDFLWEREWRFPYSNGPLAFSNNDVFVGVCPHEEIEEFENSMPNIGFIDPTRNMKWYATKLIAARQRLNLKNSVV
jgi:hypothetical protein